MTGPSTFAADAIDFLLGDESGAMLIDDNGRGCSKWGITLLTARQFYPQATADDVARMNRDQAVHFYQLHFWDRLRFGLLTSPVVATKAFDWTVNMGAGGWVLENGTRVLKAGALTILQTCAQVAVVDGILGPGTAAAVNALDPALLLPHYRDAILAHYQDLVAQNPSLQVDLHGWTNRANRLPAGCSWT